MNDYDDDENLKLKIKEQLRLRIVRLDHRNKEKADKYLLMKNEWQMPSVNSHGELELSDDEGSEKKRIIDENLTKFQLKNVN